jgi:hypothetical protein
MATVFLNSNRFPPLILSRFNQEHHMKHAITFSILLFVAAGCTSAFRTHVATLDTTVRPAKVGEIVLYKHGTKPDKAHKEIAYFTLASHGGREASVLSAFLQLARDRGADALIMDKPEIVGPDEGRQGTKGGGVVNFRGRAIVWKSHE